MVLRGVASTRLLLMAYRAACGDLSGANRSRPLASARPSPVPVASWTRKAHPIPSVGRRPAMGPALPTSASTKYKIEVLEAGLGDVMIGQGMARRGCGLSRAPLVKNQAGPRTTLGLSCPTLRGWTEKGPKVAASTGLFPRSVGGESKTRVGVRQSRLSIFRGFVGEGRFGPFPFDPGRAVTRKPPTRGGLPG